MQVGLSRYEINLFLKGEENRVVPSNNDYEHEIAHLRPYNQAFEISQDRFQLGKFFEISQSSSLLTSSVDSRAKE